MTIPPAQRRPGGPESLPKESGPPARLTDGSVAEFSYIGNQEPAPSLADLPPLTDDERATIANVIDAITTKARLRLITGNAS